MEYMLLRDGTVRVCPHIRFIPEVRQEMAHHGGVAYYWRDNEDWLFVHVDSMDSAGTVTLDVPDVIKLAAMLE